MLQTFPSSMQKTPSKALWIDVFDPNAEETKTAEALIGRPLPTIEQLSEIETSSRLQQTGNALHISIPMISPQYEGSLQHVPPYPIGFILTPDRLMTLHFGKADAFTHLTHNLEKSLPPPQTSFCVILAVLDHIVDQQADNLEHSAQIMRGISRDTFDISAKLSPKIGRTNTMIYDRLRLIGRIEERLSDTRDTLLALARAINFIEEMTQNWPEITANRSLESLQRDISSLEEYHDQLAAKTSFLLSSIVSLVGIAQNDLFKFLTIFSLVGIPPTLIAGILGMNFTHIPASSWDYGFPIAISLITLSAIAPLAWFKWRKWL